MWSDGGAARIFSLDNMRARLYNIINKQNRGFRPKEDNYIWV